MGRKLAVCVPYRNRKTHLDTFVPYLSGFLDKRNIEHKIFICNQADEKPFNRGMMKNIAFKEACKEGFDYFAFHDVDLLPADDSCDYSYPHKHPVHLCVLKSDEDFKLSYEQYFGGCVLFTKEQFERVNGYYNGYWGWGYEDDDLFYRVMRKGLADIGCVRQDIANKMVACFNSRQSSIEVIKNRFNQCTDKNGFSLFMLVKPEANAIRDYLIGKKYRFFEVPFYFVGYRDILSYNKNETFTVKLYNKLFRPNVLYGRHPKNEWAMLFLTIDPVNQKINFIINTVKHSDFNKDIRTISYKTPLMSPVNNKTIIGNKRRLFVPNNLPFNGEIAEICLWNYVFNENDMQKKINNIGEELYKDKIIFYYDFEDIKNNTITDKGLYGNHGKLRNCAIKTVESIKIRTHAQPHRRCGRFICLPHINEGMLRRHVFRKYCIKLKNEASVNEKIFKVHVIGNTINPDQHGLNSLSYKIKNKKTIFGLHTMIDAEC
jgi:hypothetical protein